jgi:hypothetical protein
MDPVTLARIGHEPNHPVGKVAVLGAPDPPFCTGSSGWQGLCGTVQIEEFCVRGQRLPWHARLRHRGHHWSLEWYYILYYH